VRLAVVGRHAAEHEVVAGLQVEHGRAGAAGGRRVGPAHLLRPRRRRAAAAHRGEELGGRVRLVEPHQPGVVQVGALVGEPQFGAPGAIVSGISNA
jgi:hypothetical protein